MAETKNEITFGEVQQHMQISEAEVEEFLIDVLNTKLVRAKIDQANQVSKLQHEQIIKKSCVLTKFPDLFRILLFLAGNFRFFERC